MDTTFSAPPPGAPPQLTARPAGPPPPQPPNRKELDSKRVLARLLDGLVAGAPAIVIALGVGRSLSVFLVSLSLTYFFICEALWGQTLGKRLLGLRVLMRDGRPATASAVSARTVLRLIDDGPLGLVVMILSGRRRQRLGDLLGGTIVARATPGLPHAELSPLMLVYPIAWAIGAMALVLVPQPENDYLARVDQVCQQRRAAFAATPRDQVTVPVMVRLGARRPPARSRRSRRRPAPRTCAARSSRSAARWSPRSTGPWRAPGPRPTPPRPSSARSPRSRRASSRWTLRYAELGLKACAGQPA